MIWLAGTAYIIDGFEDTAAFFNANADSQWPLMVLFAALLGIPIGYLYYKIGGALFHIPVLLANGYRRLNVSQNIFLYSGISLYIAALVWRVISLVWFGRFTLDESSLLMTSGLCILTGAALIHFVVLAYIGVTALQETIRWRSVVLIIVVPVSVLGFFLLGTVALTLEDDVTDVDFELQAYEQRMQGNFDEAERLLRLLRGEIPANDSASLQSINIRLAHVAEEGGDTSAAIDYYQQAMSYTDSNSADFISLLGNIELCRHEIWTAQAYFIGALVSDSNNFDAHNNLGIIYLGGVDDSVWDYELALEHNLAAYKLFSDYTTAQNLVESYWALDRYADARNTLSNLAEVYGPNDYTYGMTGLCYYYENELDSARTHLRRAVALDSSWHTEFVDEILTSE